MDFAGAQMLTRWGRGWRAFLISVLALALLVAIVFWPVWEFGFVTMDVREQLLENPYVQALTIENITHICTSRCIESFYPIRTLSFVVDYQLWGLFPGGFKTTNVVIHFVNVLLVAGLILRLFKMETVQGTVIPERRTQRFAAISAAIFAVHPVVVEPVIWVAGREELLLTFGALLCFHFHLNGRHRSNQGNHRAAFAWQVGAAMACAFACLSNTVAAVIPLLITAWDALTLPRPKTRRIATGTAVLWLIGVTTLVVKRYGYDSDSRQLAHMFTGEWLMIIAANYWRNLESLFWPRNLVFFYDWRIPESWLQADVILGLAAIAATSLLAWRFWRQKLVVFGIFWFVIALSPAAQVVPNHIPRADRFLYLPLVGLVVALGAGLALSRQRPKALMDYGVTAAGVVLVAVLTLRCMSQVQIWQDELSVWQHCAKCEPDNPLTHCTVANCYVDQNRFDKAIPHYHFSLHLYPDHTEALNNFALHLAIDEVKELRDYELALVLARRGCEITGGNDPALRHTLAVAYASSAANMVRNGKFQQAIDQYYLAIKIDPYYDVPVLNLAYLLATCSDEAFRRPEEAVRLAEESQTLVNHPDPNRMTILAEAYASADRIDAAITAAEKALELVRVTGNEEEISKLLQQLTDYRRRKTEIPVGE